MTKKIIATIALALSVSACSAPAVVEYDKEEVQRNYKQCLQEGGSFAQEANGFSCALPPR